MVIGLNNKGQMTKMPNTQSRNRLKLRWINISSLGRFLEDWRIQK
ncbi:hypothetical protein GXM_05588 [Nostoc sphaeroides CCNUC1]|uniref:Uncharacterized protein n=1 Tax=Nostoc sphaeroides CCNUC1 TaxID=2653204 RepID=A0A5P8W781_9NOSO|nr:hypothetical protein GXM_05588 [Nostoc sphaeroides CCNUC1]